VSRQRRAAVFLAALALAGDSGEAILFTREGRS
jgi:hypothetical protein